MLSSSFTLVNLSAPDPPLYCDQFHIGIHPVFTTRYLIFSIHFITLLNNMSP